MSRARRANSAISKRVHRKRSSSSGNRWRPSDSSASKAGVVNLSKFFATHWAGAGIRVNTLSPGGVLAGQDELFKSKYGARVPLRRMAEAEDLKGPLVFLASAASSYVTGHELRVEGGFTAW